MGYRCPKCGWEGASFHDHPPCNETISKGYQKAIDAKKATVDTGSKYLKKITNSYFDGPLIVDVYDVLRAFEVTDPAHAHGLKKLLCPGQRGAKDIIKDLEEGINSITKYLAFIKQGSAE